MKLFYRKYGNGPPLIILHGLYGSSDNWATIAKKLRHTFTVYLPDQRNHGLSPHSDNHDYDSMRDDIKELADNLKLRTFFLAGHSMGGKSAISYALKWPETLYGLLIADISPFTDEDRWPSAYNQHKTILEAMSSLNPASISTRKDAGLFLKNKISSEKIRNFIIKNLHRDEKGGYSWKLNVPALLKNLPGIMEGLNRENYINIQVTGFPVIFLRGSESDYLPESDFKDILKVFPAAEFIEITNAGHWLHADNPDEVIRSFEKLII